MLILVVVVVVIVVVVVVVVVVVEVIYKIVSRRYLPLKSFNTVRDVVKRKEYFKHCLDTVPTFSMFSKPKPSDNPSELF